MDLRPEQDRIRRSFRSRLSGCFAMASLGLAALLCCSTGRAQSTDAKPPAADAAVHKQATVRHGKRHTAPKTEKPPAPTAEAANPPQVKLDQGKLLVAAHNSDLSTILQDVSAQSGMAVDGLSRNTRVFGTYGPGSPRDVLSQLLTGAGYNFVMVGGGQESVPRELVLTAQNGDTLPTSAGNKGAALPPAPQTDEGDNNGESLGPGAIAHPSPQDQDTDDTNSEERMQQRLKNLQQMQQMIQQNQQQNQQNQQNQQQNQQNQPQPYPPKPPE